MNILKDLFVKDVEKTNFTGERYIPEEKLDEITIEHTQRYLFAEHFIEDKVVLDAACGEGYGSHILKQKAKEVYAVDVDKEAINKAKIKYKNDNIHFLESSIASLPYSDSMFDTIVSFETIEHVDTEAQEAFLKEAKRVLKEDGILIISTPNKYIYTDRVDGENIYHKKEFYREEFLNFLVQEFKYTYIYNQYFRVGYFINKENEKSIINMDAIDNNEARYYIVICSNKKLDIKSDDLCHYFFNGMYLDLNKNCNKLNRDIIKVTNDFNEFRDKSKAYISHLEMDISKLKTEIEKRNEEINKLYNEKNNKDQYISKLRSENSQKNDENDKLRNENSQINTINNKLENENKQLIYENKRLKELIEKPIRNFRKMLNYNKYGGQ